MKKYIVSLLVFATLFACEDFLEEKVVTTLTQDYYKTVEGLETLVNGSYQMLRFKSDYNQGHYLFGSSTDVEVFCWATAAPERQEMGSYNISGWGPNSGSNKMAPLTMALIGQTSGNVSEGVYPIVNRCNVFLENYEELSESDQERLKERRGEILFLRSYAYYLLTNQLGAAPLILESFSGMPENFAFPKASLEEIYTQLIADMTEAVEILPSSTSELGRITKLAAAHLLAKMYLNRAQAAEFENSSEPTLKALYKGNSAGVTEDLNKAIEYASIPISYLSSTSAYGGLAEDFKLLWEVTESGAGPYTRDLQTEILLSAQYEYSQTYVGRYGNTLVHLHNSNHTSMRAATPRTMEYGRPYATIAVTDWGYDMYTDRANDSRYYKTYLTDYVATDATEAGGKPWDEQTAYVYNNYIKGPNDEEAVVDGSSKIKYGERSIVYIENSKDEPLDSLWVASQPFIMNVRWTVGSPGGNGYFVDPNDPSKGLKAGIDLTNPVVTDLSNRNILYRVSGDAGQPGGLDRGGDAVQWYMCTKKWLDPNRGRGTDPNGNGAIDVVLMRLAETYLIRAEAYGRLGNETAAITDLNVLRRRAAYKSGETRSDVLTTLEPALMTGRLQPAADAESAILVTGREWTPGTDEFILENYPEGVTNYFVHFIYNEYARELCFELNLWEALHNAGIWYERVVARDMMGAPSTSTGTTYFPFPKDDISVTDGALGYGKGTVQRMYSFRPWPQSYLDVLTDENGNALDDAAKNAYQNYGY